MKAPTTISFVEYVKLFQKYTEILEQQVGDSLSDEKFFSIVLFWVRHRN